MSKKEMLHIKLYTKIDFIMHAKYYGLFGIVIPLNMFSSMIGAH